MKKVRVQKVLTILRLLQQSSRGIYSILFLAVHFFLRWRVGGFLIWITSIFSFLLCISFIRDKTVLVGIDEAIGWCCGIFIHSDYFGIMAYGIARIDWSVFKFFHLYISLYYFPIFTFISAGIVNVFVPSWWRTWAVHAHNVQQHFLGVDCKKFWFGFMGIIYNMWHLGIIIGNNGLKQKKFCLYLLDDGFGINRIHFAF